MQLLVSVSDAEETRAALVGGASIIDAKDPARGPLGPVSEEALGEIVATAGGSRPVSAALGDAHSESAVAAAARNAAATGAAFVKVGFRGIASEGRVIALAAAAVRGATSFGTRVVLAAYADAHRARSLPPRLMLDLAVHARAAGIVIDTAVKDGSDLFTFIDPDAADAIVRRAHALDLVVTLAGALDIHGIALARELGADIAGVRGAACIGGRLGRISAERVRALADAARGEGDSATIVGSALTVLPISLTDAPAG